MHVLSLLGQRELQQLRRAAPESWVVRSLSLRVVLEELAAGAGGVVVLDPAELDSGAFEQLLARAGMAGARLVLCGEALDIGAAVLVDAVDRAHVEVLATAVGDSRGSARTLISMQAPSIPTSVLRAIGARLLRLPGRAAINAVRLFSFAPLPGSVEAMCAYVGRHQTTLGDYHRVAGICEPRRLLAIGRVARALHYAASGLRPTPGIAAVCGFKSQRAMLDALRNVVDVSYNAALTHCERETVTGRLVALVVNDGSRGLP